MNIENISTGMNLRLNGKFPCTVTQVDRKRISSWGFFESSPVQISVELHPDDGPQLLWVHENRLSKEA